MLKQGKSNIVRGHSNVFQRLRYLENKFADVEGALVFISLNREDPDQSDLKNLTIVQKPVIEHLVYLRLKTLDLPM